MKEKITVKLIGEDGNIFNLMGICTRELRRAGQKDVADELVKDITTNANSYEDALATIMKYVDVI